MLKRYGTEWIVSITDVSEFCKKQHQILLKEGENSDNFLTASERVFSVDNSSVAARIGVDFIPTQTVVSMGAYR